jgi:7-carboxy-7-deazaguanine synthase
MGLRMMRISEIFYSLQGEGMLTGVPSVFIRTSGCNLRCSWCDTKYASWTPESGEMSLSSILEKVYEFPSHHCVLTGGEPTIVDGIQDLAHALRSAGKHITIESNGTQFPSGIKVDLASLSPKLSNSVPDSATYPQEANMQRLERRWNLDALREWIDCYDYQLKFVVMSGGDIDEIKQLLDLINRDVPPDRVMMMPEGIDTDTIRGRNETLVDLCKQYGYRYCRRLHIELYGNTRGT